tara:strand:+ start:19001 stop:20689 length:1689 start_codon:yes stop_codon:yes gene_type:complete
MADNTTTYKAVIDVETQGAKNIDLLNKTISTSIGEFDNLNEAIGKTQDTLGKIDPKSKEFKELSKELEGLKDTLKDTEIQSVRFTEALGAQPGVIGLVGQSMEGLRGTLKVFMANPIIAVVTLIAGAFLAMRESLSKTTEGQETLNKISAAFGKIAGPIFALIEKIALPIFESFAMVIEKVAAGINRFAKFLGISEEKIAEASRNSSEVLQTAYEEEEKRQEDQTKTQESNSRKRIENLKKEAEEKKALMENAAKIQDEAELSLLDEKQREIVERERRFIEEMKILKAAGYTEFSALESEYRLDLKNIEDSYKVEVKDTTEADKEAELEQRSTDRQNELDFLQADFELKQAMNLLKFGDDLILYNKQRELQRQELVDTKATQQQLIAFDKETTATQLQITEASEQAKLGVVSDALGMISQAVGENSVAGKAAAVAQATIQTYLGATKALATYPPPFGAIAAGVTIASGLLQVKKIISTKLPKPPGGSLPSGGGGGGGGGASVPTTTVPEIQTAAAVEANTGNQIAESIATSSQRPVQAYVVSTEVSSTQALDRRTNSAASFG